MKNIELFPSLVLNPDLLAAIHNVYAKKSTSQQMMFRIKIVLTLSGAPVNFTETASKLHVDRGTVRMWYLRLSEANERWDEMVASALGEIGHAGVKLRKDRLVLDILADRQRSGAPNIYTAINYTDLVAMAMTPPSECGRAITHWTARELADELNLRNIIPGISARQVGRFLEEADLKPHKSRYWLNAKIVDQVEFSAQSAKICDLYQAASALQHEGVRVVSTDEKTSIQALERCAPTKPMIPGNPEKIEFEYKRHGTQCLIPVFDVATGKIVSYYIGETRDEDDFAGHIKNMIATDPTARWKIVADQLNTHLSESLVRLAAELSGYEGELGEKGRFGILKDLKSRKAFLENENNKIQFVYTPKHCSWLNQVEIWFGVVVRKVLKRGNFISTDDLKCKLMAFIEYFNETMAKPYQWTYKGKLLAA